ncbi:MAG: cob(I)yrinic acid a,c-diamide adenosyltransferase [Nitrospirae bacterium]|nr:cob(I)yrinic acid a,c-diamide adenosyltransferase [Nitrospirota bacterium]
MRKGYIQVYTGNGKGKTTAALGLALRAAGAGLRVFFAQFVKKKRCSEHKILEKFEGLITVKQYGNGLLLKRTPGESDIKAAGEGLREIREIIQSNRYDVIILDEANIAIHYNLFTTEDMLELMAAKPSMTELVITGRYADERVIQRADLVTEMRELKHYFEKGVKARIGIEF